MNTNADLTPAVVNSLTGAQLADAYKRVLGVAPKPKTPTPALRKKILQALAIGPVDPTAGDEPRDEPIVERDPDAEIDAEHDYAMSAAREAVSNGAVATECSSLVGLFQSGEIVRAEFDRRLAQLVAEANAPATTDDNDAATEATIDATATNDATTDSDANVGETDTTDATTTAPTATPKKRGRKPSATKPATEPTSTTDTTPATSTKHDTERTLPPIGTILIKRDRNGAERCRCTIVEGGVEFNGTVYKSLSAAAIAASKSLGNQTKQTSGPKFWGVIESKPRTATTKGIDLEVIGRAWDRYRERAEAAVKSASDDDKAKLRDVLLAQSSTLFALATPTATTTETQV